MKSADHDRLLMIGVDAADIDYILLHRHRLPNLNRLIEDGPLLRVNSAETLPGSVWPSFYSYSSPGVHGIYYPMQWDAQAMRLRRVSPDWLPVRTFFSDFEAQGIPLTVLDVPLCPPSGLRLGTEVLNWSAQENMGEIHCSTPGMDAEIRRRFGSYPLGDDIPVPKTQGQLRTIRRALLFGLKRKAALSMWLMRNTRWRLFLTVFAECHRAGHNFWPDPSLPEALKDGLIEVYQAMDQAIGEMIAAVDLEQTTVVVFSPYGMGANHAQMHFMPAVVERINSGFLNDGGAAPSQRSMMRRLRERLPARLQYAIARRVPAVARDRVTNRAFTGHDWRRTPGVAMLSGGEGFIRLNLAGRERRGALRPGPERERYLEWVKDSLLTLRASATGQALVREVSLASERHPGPRSGLLPDLIANWNPIAPASAVESPTLGRFRAPLGTGRGGNHRPGGFAVVAGRRRQEASKWPLKNTEDFAGWILPLLTGSSGLMSPALDTNS